MKKCSIFCEVKDCVNYAEGFCNLDNINRVVFVNGVPTCDDYHSMSKGTILAGALMEEIKRQLLIEHGDRMEEDLADYELCTDSEFNCFMHQVDSDCMHDFTHDEAIASLVDAYNTVMFGKPLHCRMSD